MFIDLNIIYGLLAILGAVALVCLIIALINLNKLIKNSNTLVVETKDSVSDSVLKLPEVISNFSTISENLKDVSDVATDVTADFIVTKESMKSNVEVATEIINILKAVFIK
ncbi:MAG: hypothetical protein ACRDA3_03240 [Peptostreptococcaceae bacterium]